MAIKIIVADDVEEMREMIAKMLSTSDLEHEIIAMCATGQEVLNTLESKQADLILMDINMPEMNGLEATEIICRNPVHPSVIMMSVQHESEYLKKAMLAGAKAYIMKPVDMDELVETIQTTYDRNKLSLAKPVIGDKQYSAKIITFFSSKGGVGNTFIAVNAGLIISEKLNKKVLIIDLDLQFGDVSLMVNKQSELTIKALFDDSPISRYEDVSPYLYHYSKNCDMLFAPKDPESAEYIAKDQVKQLIELLKAHYDYLIIDTGVNYNDITLNALDQSDKVIVVSGMEVTSLKNTKMSLKVMQSLNYNSEKVKLLITQVNEKFGVTKNNVLKAFDYEIYGFISEESKIVKNAINTGVPLVMGKSNVILKQLESVCQKIMS
ncbi:MAG: hypothetical protein BGO41_04270 [Clostridiales bacterium 38-18]|nr:MAG: hypothetical protein BGO41_04270 [Clostridiales bacterium 38-18]